MQNDFEGTTDNVTVSQCDVDCPCCPLLSLSGQGINWIMGSAALERERYCTNAFSRHSFLIVLQSHLNSKQCFCSTLMFKYNTNEEFVTSSRIMGKYD